MKTFKINRYYLYTPEKSECPDNIPWELIEPHRRQAMYNHSQTLERLDERGGLSPIELYFVLNDRDYSEIEVIKEKTESFCINWLLGKLKGEI